MLRSKSNRKHIFTSGFTMVELLVTIAILGIITAIGIPGLSEFIVKTRVDSQVSEIHRLILTARNTAINTGQNVTICPLSGNTCGTNWHSEVSVFVDNNNDGDYDANDTLVKVKSAIQNGDKLQYAQSSLVYTPSGTLSGGAAATPFNYCPNGHTDKSRGIVVSASGRAYATSDTDNDGKDEDRNNNEITCI